ncbi:N-acetyltransferase family protein [Pararhizobium sp. LjRoot238]|uniref:GNAT family N-acetyltransferase n=1 Tax=Pararhizobium sp. LjRoot238 TaxID=3342293 RepID=UPI003F50B21C
MSDTITDTVIRRLSVDDVGVFRDIRLEALSCEPNSFASLHEDWINLSEQEWRQRLEQPVFVALLNEQPCGMMGLRFQKARKMMHRATLTSVYVRKPERGKGIASDLLGAVANHARELGMLQLELGVSAENSAAIRFYQRYGFEPVGRIPRGFRDNGMSSDEVLMLLPLEKTRE